MSFDKTSIHMMLNQPNLEVWSHFDDGGMTELISAYLVRRWLSEHFKTIPAVIHYHPPLIASEQESKHHVAMAMLRN